MSRYWGALAYSAFEPDLLLWVLATLITAAVHGYEFIYGELPIARKEGFYRDMCRFGTYFGVDESLSPKGWHAFEVYYNNMLEGDLLGSHWMSRKLARAVIQPQDCAGTRLLGRCMDFLPIETLPSKVRDRLELQSTISSRFRMRLLRRLV
ncbi:MAG: oxygenase MpaB family protein [Terrimicrobiaceae bacterium]